MNTRELTKILKDSLEMQAELVEFAEGCLKEIFGEKSQEAIYEFHSYIDYFEEFGCIQSVNTIRENMKRHEEEVKKYQKEREESKNKEKK